MKLANRRRYKQPMEHRLATRVSAEMYEACEARGLENEPPVRAGTYARFMVEEALKSLRDNGNGKAVPPEAPGPYYRDMNLMLPSHLIAAIESIAEKASRTEKRAGPAVILRRLIRKGLDLDDRKRLKRAS